MPAEQRHALLDAAVDAVMGLALGPEDLASAERLLHPAAVAMAFAMVEGDPLFASRWRAAGTDWSARGTVFRDALLWILTPETSEEKG